MVTKRFTARSIRVEGRRVWVTIPQQQLARLLTHAGIGYRQNVLIEGYEADLLVAGGLIVEVDGSVHDAVSGHRHDQAKQACWERAGYDVLHIRNVDVKQSGRDCVRRVRQAVSERDRRGAHVDRAPWQHTLATLLA